MSRYLLDTNTVSLLVRRNLTIYHRLQIAVWRQASMVLSPVVDYEVMRGLQRKHATTLLPRYERFTERFEYVPFDRNTWRRAADLWAFSRDQGFPLPDADLLIAAQALELDAVLVTHNIRHFALFEPAGLRTEDWTAA